MLVNFDLGHNQTKQPTFFYQNNGHHRFTRIDDQKFNTILCQLKSRLTKKDQSENST